jgi:hypothetical protein
VFGYAHAGTGDYKGRCRRNIEGAAGIATGATGIDESVAPSAARVENGVGVEFEWNRGGADGFGKADDFFDRFALHVQRHQQRRNLRVGALAGENLGHHRARFFAGERLPVRGDSMEDVEDHKLQATADTRYLSNRICGAVASGVNLTIDLRQAGAKAIAPAFGRELDGERPLQGFAVG